MFGSRFLLSVAAFLVGGLAMLTLISWDLVDPLYPHRLGLFEVALYFGMAVLPAVFWLAVFCRERKFQRRY